MKLAAFSTTAGLLALSASLWLPAAAFSQEGNKARPQPAPAVQGGKKTKPQLTQAAAAEAEKLFVEGVTLGQTGKLDEAIAKTQEAVALNPNHASAQFNLGFLLSQKGRMDEAIRHARIAVKLDPKNNDARYNLAYFLQTKGKNRDAAQLYREILKVNPNYVRAQFHLGVILTSMGKFEEAAIHCKKAAELVPPISGPSCKK